MSTLAVWQPKDWGLLQLPQFYSHHSEPPQDNGAKVEGAKCEKQALLGAGGPVERSKVLERFRGTSWSSRPWVCLDNTQKSPLLTCADSTVLCAC